ncbi:UvrABC system protein B [compost metagenome]
MSEVKQAKMSKKDRISLIERLEQEMKEAAKNLQFERAAELRDAVLELKAEL